MSNIDQLGDADWTRVLQLGGSSWLGLAHGELFVGETNAPTRRVDPASPTGLLPVLERPLGSVLDEVRARELDLGLPEGELATLVPVSAIVREAVRTRLEYWTSLALDWLDGMPELGEFAEVLSEVESASWAPQRMRHRATRLLNEVRRTGA